MKIRLILFFMLWMFQSQAAQAILLDRILAVVNGEIISLSDVEKELFFFDGMNSSLRGETLPDSAVQEEIQRLIHHKLLLAEAKRFDVENPTDAQVQEKLEMIQKRFGSPEAFENALRQHHMTIEDLKQKIAEHLMVDQFIDQRIRFFILVLPEEISRYYEEHQSDFQNRPYPDVEKEIERLLSEKKEKEKLEDYLSRVKTKASIQINFE